MDKSKELQQQAFRLLAELSQFIKKEFKDVVINRWQQIVFPDGHPLKRSNHSIGYQSVEEFPIQQIGTVTRWLCQQLQIESTAICVSGQQRPDGQSTGRCLIPDIENLLKQPKVQSVLLKVDPPSSAKFTGPVIEEIKDEKQVQPKSPAKEPQTAAPKAQIKALSKASQLKKDTITTTPDIATPNVSSQPAPKLKSGPVTEPAKTKVLDPASSMAAKSLLIDPAAESVLKHRTPTIHEAVATSGKQSVPEKKPEINSKVTASSSSEAAPILTSVQALGSTSLQASAPTMIEAQTPAKVISPTPVSSASSVPSQNPAKILEQTINNTFSFAKALLRIEEDLLNHLPFFAPAEALAHHSKFQQRVHDLNLQIKTLIEAGKLDELTSRTRDLSGIVASEAEKLLELFKGNIAKMRRSLLFDQYREVEKSLKADVSQFQELNQKWQNVIKILGELKEKSQEFLKKNSDFYEKIDLTQEQILATKILQHEIAAYKRALKEIVYGYHQLALHITPASHYLPTEEYFDVIFLSHLVTPQEVESCLQRQCQVFAERYRQYEHQVKVLQRIWQQVFPDIFRLYRNIDIYTRWKMVLEKLREKFGQAQAEMKWTELSELYKALTYEKKSFFREGIRSQQGMVLVQSLFDLYNVKKDELNNHSKALQYFSSEKEKLKTEIEHQKSQLTQYVTRLGKSFAMFELAVTQQPDFQYGALGSTLIEAGFSYPSRSYAFGVIGGEPLPPALLNKVKYASGLTVLFMGLTMSSAVGYTYHSIAALNRILLGQFDNWQWAGEQLNRVMMPLMDKIVALSPAEYYELCCQLKNAANFDEVGLIDKDEYLTWLSGLVLNLALSPSQHWFYASAGYATATAVSGTISRVINFVAGKMDISKGTAQVVSSLGHMAVYSYAYRTGTAFAYGFFPPEHSQEMSYREALSVMGVDKSVTEEELSDRYHDLARQHHPDRCTFFCKDADTSSRCVVDCKTEAHSKMGDINIAYNVLSKKMQ